MNGRWNRWWLRPGWVVVMLGIGSVVSAEVATIDADAPQHTVYLVAARQKPRIAESLRSAGIGVVDDVLGSPALLRVTVGNEKGFQSCGTKNNVKYELRIEGQRVLEQKELGWTGSCEPNVFDELSRRLARALSQGEKR